MLKYGIYGHVSKGIPTFYNNVVKSVSSHNPLGVYPVV